MKLSRLPPSTLRPLPTTVRTVDLQSWRSGKTGSTARGYGYAWQKARAGHLRSHPYCVFCLRDAGITATSIEGIVLACAEKGMPAPLAHVVDHRVPHGGDQRLFWDRTNWQGLCTSHHSGEKQRQERAGAVPMRIGRVSP